MEPKNLKLIARTEEDLRVVSAHLTRLYCKYCRYSKFKKK